MNAERRVQEIVKQGANPGLEALMCRILRLDLHLEMVVLLDHRLQRPINWWRAT